VWVLSFAMAWCTLSPKDTTLAELQRGCMRVHAKPTARPLLMNVSHPRYGTVRNCAAQHSTQRCQCRLQQRNLTVTPAVSAT
jgi:hypothetical protein